jgi:hypothetical protein
VRFFNFRFFEIKHLPTAHCVTSTNFLQTAAILPRSLPFKVLKTPLRFNFLTAEKPLRQDSALSSTPLSHELVVKLIPLSQNSSVLNTAKSVKFNIMYDLTGVIDTNQATSSESLTPLSHD